MIALRIILHHFVASLQRYAGIMGVLLGAGSSLAAESAAISKTQEPASAVVTLKVLNREVMVFRANLGTYSPEQRAAAAQVRIAQALLKPGGVRTDSELVDGTAEIRVHGQTVFLILPKDVNELQGESFDSVVQKTGGAGRRAVATARQHPGCLQ